MLCLEQNGEWLVGRHYLSAAAMEPLVEMRLHRDPTPERDEVGDLTQPEQPNDYLATESANSYTTSRDLTGG